MEEQFQQNHGRMADQVVIVTGAASGIGRSTCLAMAREGARLAAVDLNRAGLDGLAAELAAQGAVADERLLVLTANVRREQDMEEMVEQTLTRFGRIDILIHCAGILRGQGSSPKFLHQVSLEEFEAVVDTNLKGTFLCNRAVLPPMIQQRRGQIINLSSTSGLEGRAFDSVYCASKFGVVGLSKALAEEVRQYGIKVNLVLPDAVDTPMWDQNGPIRAPYDSLPPQRVADLIVYLALLPYDTILDNLVILPNRTRRRKKSAGQTTARDAGADQG